MKRKLYRIGARNRAREVECCPLLILLGHCAIFKCACWTSVFLLRHFCCDHLANMLTSQDMLCEGSRENTQLVLWSIVLLSCCQVLSFQCEPSEGL